MRVSRVLKIVICLLLAMYFLRRSKKSDRVFSRATPTKLSTLEQNEQNCLLVIHIGLILHGQRTILRAQTMLKSLLFHQNRTGEIADRCGNCAIHSSSQCAKRRSIQSFPVRVHAAVSHQNRKLVKILLIDAKVTAVQWTLYELVDYLPLVALVHNTHGSGPTALLKLMWPFMLTPEAERLLTLDADTLFNHDVAELWKSFDSLQGNETIGLAYEQARGNAHFLPDREHPFPRMGLNSGVILWNMRRMRTFSWSCLLREALNPQAARSAYGDQSLINRIVRRNPGIYFHISCEWHIQICCGGLKEDCPVVWPEWKSDERACKSLDFHVGTVERPKLLFLAHYNTGSKPENLDWELRYHNPLERASLLNESLGSECKYTVNQISSLLRSNPRSDFQKLNYLKAQLACKR